MKYLCILCCFSAIIQADPAAMQQMMQQKYEMLLTVDKQIENLVQERMMLQSEMAQHMEREETSIRPRVDLRQEEAMGHIRTQIQDINTQLSQLEL